MHVVEPNHLAPIYMKLSASNIDNFHPTLKDRCRVTAQRICLAPLVIHHEVENMIREVRFATKDYASLMVGSITLLFGDHVKNADENLQAKV